ncbi:recQ-mediated genome instability protein 2 [Protopterus annectens]|uniref:recQ-mediated genome instability protein 2 n=1 Tax=Protopterus annectens TaxID=7888 RepID=UPI001CFA8F96|nr:recQ-mediated genome instability protein 2 [Protopterus annectens]
MDNVAAVPQCKSTPWKYQSPPIKILSHQLKRCESRIKNNAQISFWFDRSVQWGKSALDVTVVWMQGTIHEITGEKNTTAKIQDDSGMFTVTGVDSVPKGKPFLIKGKYVMVMGVVQSCTPEPVIRAVKITDLSENPIHKKAWLLEVEDLHRTLP